MLSVLDFLGVEKQLKRLPGVHAATVNIATNTAVVEYDETITNVEALRAKGLRETGVFRHVVKNAAPTALAVMGLQLGYMLGGSILIETVFSWPGSGLLLNSAIFQRDLPLLQGTILVLSLFFVILNLLVDIAQAAIDPRIKRG